MSAFLVGEKLYLRAPERSDAAQIRAWFARAEVRRGTRQYRPRSLQAQEQFLEQGTSAPEHIVFAAALREDDRLVGVCGLHHIDARNHHAELGMVIGDPADWGRGLGSETASLLIGYGFDTVNLHRIWLEVYEDNTSARKIYEKLGFRLEGTMREHGFREGRWWNLHYMGLLADEYRVARK
jgi:RimJ/RimL family protein N-acetyltransferase